MLGLIGVLAALESRATSGRASTSRRRLWQSTFVYSYDGMRHPDPDVNRSLSLVQGRDPHNDAPGYRIAEAQMGAGSIGQLRARHLREPHAPRLASTSTSPTPASPLACGHWAMSTAAR